jgi:hypothetical protein
MVVEAVVLKPRNRRELSGIAVWTNEWPDPSIIRSLARRLSLQGGAQIVSDENLVQTERASWYVG